MVQKLFPKINDIKVTFIIKDIEFSTDDFVSFKQTLKGYLETKNKQNIEIRFTLNDKIIKEYEITLNQDEEIIYFKRNVINMLSSDEDEIIKNQYKVVCVGKKLNTGIYELTYYHFDSGIEIKSTDINYVPIF